MLGKDQYSELKDDINQRLFRDLQEEIKRKEILRARRLGKVTLLEDSKNEPSTRQKSIQSNKYNEDDGILSMMVNKGIKLHIPNASDTNSDYIVKMCGSDSNSYLRYKRKNFLK